MRVIWSIFLLTPIMALALEIDSRGQDKVFAFCEYKIKDGVGMKDAFNAGYKRDLEWHKSQGDDWDRMGANGAGCQYFHPKVYAQSESFSGKVNHDNEW